MFCWSEDNLLQPTNPHPIFEWLHPRSTKGWWYKTYILWNRTELGRTLSAQLGIGRWGTGKLLPYFAYNADKAEWSEDFHDRSPLCMAITAELLQFFGLPPQSILTWNRLDGCPIDWWRPSEYHLAQQACCSIPSVACLYFRPLSTDFGWFAMRYLASKLWVPFCQP